MPTLEIVTTHPPLSLLYALSSPVIEISGKLTEARWGVTTFELPPGEYDVAIAVPGLFRPRRGRNVVFIRLHDGDFKRVRYTAPAYSIVPGKIEVESTLPRAWVP